MGDRHHRHQASAHELDAPADLHEAAAERDRNTDMPTANSHHELRRSAGRAKGSTAIVGNVVANDGTFGELTVDKGTDRGVESGMAALVYLDAGGVLAMGTVTSVTKREATISIPNRPLGANNIRNKQHESQLERGAFTTQLRVKLAHMDE